MEIKDIFREVQKKYGFDITRKNQNREIVEARQIYCYLARKHTKTSLDKIGSLINKNHGTVLYSDNLIKNLLTYDKKLQEMVTVIELSLYDNVTSFYQDVWEFFIKNSSEIKNVRFGLKDKYHYIIK